MLILIAKRFEVLQTLSSLVLERELVWKFLSRDVKVVSELLHDVELPCCVSNGIVWWLACV